MGLWDASLAFPQSGSPLYTDLLSFTFCNANYDPNRPIFIDAEDPSRSLTVGQFRLLVRTLIAGLKAHHVQRGDCVLVHLGNNVSDLQMHYPLHTELLHLSLFSKCFFLFWLLIPLFSLVP